MYGVVGPYHFVLFLLESYRNSPFLDAGESRARR